jgi:anti-sigma factor RsiW
MNCRESRQLLSARADRELSGRDAEALELHLRSCEACSALAAREASFVQGLKASLPKDTIPADLKARLLGSLSQPPVAAAPALWRRGLALAGTALSLWVLFLVLSPRSAGADWTQFYRDEHQAHNSPQLRVQHGTPSAPALAAWFQASLKHPVHVPEMEDAKLIGGRISVLRGQPIGLAVYESQGRTMSLFMGDEATLCPQGLHKADGELFSQSGPTLALVAWRRNGHFHVAVSDLPLAHLQKLARQCQGIRT